MSVHKNSWTSRKAEPRFPEFGVLARPARNAYRLRYSLLIATVIHIGHFTTICLLDVAWCASLGCHDLVAFGRRPKSATHKCLTKNLNRQIVSFLSGGEIREAEFLSSSSLPRYYLVPMNFAILITFSCWAPTISVTGCTRYFGQSYNV